MRGLIFSFFMLLTIVSYGQVAFDPIADQLTGRGGKFEAIDLSALTSDNVFWEAEFLKPAQPTIKPDWTVNTNAFQLQMNLTVKVNSKGSPAIGDAHLLAVVNKDERIQGLASALKVGNDWVYFMTANANQNGEELFFRFYDDSLKQIINGTESFNFTSNAIVGQPDDPSVINIAIFKIDLVDNKLNIIVEDPSFVGSESVIVTARSLNDPNDLADQTVNFTILDDFVPQISGIPNQTTDFEDSFTTFDLDEYVALSDEDEITFSFSGNGDLSLAIDANNVVTLTKPNDWSGTEIITFYVTDQTENAFSSSFEVTFRGKTADQAPIIANIENQVTGLQGVFKTIQLDEVITAGNPEAITWEIDFETDSTVAEPDWSVNTKAFQFNMSVTIQASAFGKLLIGDDHLLAAFSETNDKLIGSVKAINVNNGWYYFLTINNNLDTDKVYFKVYEKSTSRILPVNQTLDFVANGVIGDPLDPFALEAGYIFPKIDNNLLSFSLRQTNWTGIETIKLTATDTQTNQLLSDEAIFNLEVIDLKPPMLARLDKIIVEEGTAFSKLDLNNILSNVPSEEISWSITGADTLQPTLTGAELSFSVASEHYFGSETITIQATSTINESLFATVDWLLETVNNNDEPVFNSTPTTIANLDELYRYDIIIDDYDNDELTLTIENLPNWLFYVETSTGGTILGIPTTKDAGEYSFEIEVKDALVSTKQAVDINVAYAQIEDLADQIINEGNIFTPFSLNNVLTKFGTIDINWSVSTGSQLIAEVTDNTSLNITTPNENWFGEEVFTLTIRNAANNNLLDNQEIKYIVNNVNDAPSITSAAENKAVINATYSYDFGGSDIDGDMLTASVTDLPSWLTFTAKTNGATLLGIPTKDNAGPHSFTLSLSDGSETVTQQVDIVVASARILTIVGQTIDEGGAFTSVDLNSFLEVFGDLNISWSVGSGVELTPAIDDSNILSVGIPDADWFGSESIVLTITDIDQNQVLDTRTLAYEVSNLNDAPTITSTAEDKAVINATFSYDFVGADIDGDMLTASVTDLPSWLTFTAKTNGATLLGIPTKDNAGPHSFTLSLSDGSETVTQQVDIVVASARILTIVGQTVDEGGAFTSVDLNSFLEVFGDLNISWSVGSGVELTPAIDDSNILSVGIPDADWFGSESIVLTITDVDQNQVLDTRTLTYEVSNVNDAPTITSTSPSELTIGNSYNYLVTTNDIDKDELSVTIPDLPTWLTFVPNSNGGSVFGTPQQNNAGSHSYTVQVSDGIEIVTQQVDLLVVSAQILTINNQTIDEGGSFNAIILDNFLEVFGTFNIGWSVSGHSDLTATINEQNELIVSTPNEDWFGEETITVTLTDNANSGVLDEQDIVFTVENVNDAPNVIESISEIVLPGVNFSQTVSVSDIDLDLLVFTVTLDSDWLTINTQQNGLTIFGTAPNRIDTVKFTVAIDDGMIISSFSGTVIVDFVLGSDLIAERNVQFYPNPAQDYISVDNFSEIQEVIIFDLQGKSMITFLYPNSRMDISTLMSGAYLVKTLNKNGQSIQSKMIIRRP